MDAARELAERARRLGPLPCSALPNQGGPAPSGVEDWMVATMDAEWDAAGRPDPFVVVELGAGDGARARAVLAAGPACLDALRYVLVEDAAALRSSHSKLLSIEAPAFLFPAGPADPDDPDEPPGPAPGIGPLLTSLADPPVLQGRAVVFAVGCVGRLPFDLYEYRAAGWHEVRLAASADQSLSETLVAAERPPLSLVPVEGARYAVLGAAGAWLGQMLRIAESGTLAVIDRWTAATGPLVEGVPPVALDQLSSVRRPLLEQPEEVGGGVQAVRWRLG
jgi:hypothetical protein